MLRRLCPLIKKCLVVVMVSSVFCITLAVASLNISAVQGRVSQGVAAWLSHRMDYPVVVDRVRTNGITYVHVDGIAVPDLAVSVASVRIQYNLARLLLQPHRPLSALTHVVVDQVAVDVTRNANQHLELSAWIQALFPQSAGSTRSSGGFRGVFSVTGVSGGITDQRGWLKRPLPEPFSRRYNQGRVSIDFRDSPRVINASARVQPASESETAVLVKVNGVWQTRQAYQLTVSAQDVSVAPWGRYFFHQPGYDFLSGKAAVTGKITPNPALGNKPEFSFDVYAEQAVINVPFFDSSIQAITTRFRVNREGLQFFPTTGKFLDHSVQAHGTIGFQTKQIDLNMTAESVSMSTLESVFPAVRLPVSGVGQSAVLRVHGVLPQPAIVGSVRFPAVQPLSQAMIQDAVVGYRYYQKKLTVSALGGRVQGGTVSGQVVLAFEPDQPTHIEGRFAVIGSPRLGDSNVVLSGPLHRYTATLSVAPKTIVWQGQTVDRIHAIAIVSANAPILVPTASIIVNQTGRLQAQGQVSRQGDADLVVWGRDIPVLGGKASIQSSVAGAIPKMIANPLTARIQATIAGEGIHFPDIGVGGIQATVVHDAHRTILTGGKVRILGGEFLVTGARHNTRITADVSLRVTAIPPILARLKWGPTLAKNGKTSGAFQVVYADGRWQASGWQEAAAMHVNGVAIDSMETHWQYSPDAWSLRQLKVRMPGTRFVADVGNSAAQQTIRVMAGSRIQLQSIRPWFSGYGDFLGDCRFQESQWVLGKNSNLDIQAECESLMVNSLVLPLVSVAMHQKNDTVILESFRVREAGSEVSVSGQIHSKTRDMKVTAKLKQIAWQRLRRMAKQAQIEFLNLKHLVEPVGVTSPQGIVPRVGHSGTRLWGGESAVSAFSSVVSDLAMQRADAKKPAIWDQLSASISGELVVEHTAKRPWPAVTGALDFQTVSLEGIAQAKAVRVVVSNDSDNTRIQTSVKGLQVGHARLNRWHQTLQLRPDGYMVFESGHSVDHDSVRHPAIVTGQWPLMAMLNKQDAPIAVTIQLPGSAWGALGAWVPALQSMRSDGPVRIVVGGGLSQPTIVSASAVLRNTTGQIDVGGDGVFMGVDDGVIAIHNNRMELSDLGVYWTQMDTLNRLVVSGPIDIQLPAVVGGLSGSVRVAVAVAPTQLNLVVPNRFWGGVYIQSGRIIGQYPGQVMAMGDIKLAQAVVSPQKSQSSGQLRDSLVMNVNLSIGPDVSVSGYMMPPTLLTVLSHSIDLKLAEGHPPVIIRGPLNNMALYNYIQVTDGYVQVANRSFRLMKSKEQDQFFSQNTQKTGVNRIVFSGSSPPNLSFRAISFSDVRQYSVSANVVREDAQSAMVAVIEGDLKNPQSVWFEQYRVGYPFLPSSLPEFRRKYRLQTTVYDALATSEQTGNQLFEALVSDGDLRDNAGGNESGSVRVEEMGQHRLNAFFNTQVFQPVERLIQKRTGLYQVQIDYNPGQAIIQSDESVFVQSGVGLNFIEQLTDRLYARIRTDFGVYEDNRPVSEYELSYYLRRNLSVNYGQTRRLNIIDDAFIPRVFIKYNHVF